MAMNFTTLIADKDTSGSIKRFCNYALIDPEMILEEAQALIYQRLRCREMRAFDDTLLGSPGDQAIALPDGFLDPIHVKDITHQIDLRLVNEQKLLEMRQYDASTNELIEGIPCKYAIFNEELNFEFMFEEETDIHMLFFQRPDLLSATNLTNFLTDRYPHILRSFCQASAADFMRNDTDSQKYMARGIAFIEQMASQDDLSRRGEDMAWEVPGL